MTFRHTTIALAVFVLFALTAGKFPDIANFYKTVNFHNADAGVLSVKSNCVSETMNSGAITETITGVIPARVSPLAVTCRVDTVLAGAGLTTWSLGDGTDADLYGATLALAAGTVVDKTTWTANPQTQAFSTSAGNLTMTGAAGIFSSGVITCCAHYLDATAPAT